MIKARLKQTIDRSSSRFIPFHSKDTSQPNPISSTSSSKHIRSNEVHVERKIVITKSGVGGKKRKGVGVGRDRGRVYGRVRYHSRFESIDFHVFFFWRNKKEKKISNCREKREKDLKKSERRSCLREEAKVWRRWGERSLAKVEQRFVKIPRGGNR